MRYRQTRLLLFLLPKLGHVFQGLALRLGYKLPHEDGGNDANDSVEGIGEHVAELVTHLAQTHVVHGQEGGGDDEVEYPLESYGYGHSCTTDGVGEDFGNQHPADGSPAEHERSTVDHDAEHGHQRRKAQ